ncbi:MAG TPA: M48 family metallopeptidase [Opitutaceae bacterium]|nr:M48 family metallopeptidase [Opitutaceae bacterium]
MVLTLVAVLISVRLAAQLLLNALNASAVRAHAAEPPPAAAAIMDPETYAKAGRYTLAKLRLGSIEEICEAVVLAAVIFSGVLPRLYAPFQSWAPGRAWAGALYLLAMGALLGAPSLPFDWWGQFRLEQRFGFNQSTFRLWVTDKLKGLFLTLVIGWPLLWALLGLVRWTGALWWLWGFALVFGFQLLMIVLYPKLILPLFNKLTPLAAGDLQARLLALADRTGFRARAIQVMDGSKRSAHSNAFFTGFGRLRRIVLYDTLVDQLGQPELEAVLAHEIGHYKRGHIPKMLALSAALQFGGFALLAWLGSSPWFNAAFGFPPGALAPTFLLFGLLSGLLAFWFTPLVNLLSRRHEYEADAFARDAVGGAAPVVAALRKLAQKNLSNLTPHPLYSGFHYSHPTLAEREQALTRAV